MKEIKMGLVGGIQRFSTSDGPGIRTTVFLKGCPLRCKWCHNPELIDMDQQLMRSESKCIGCGACVDICKKGAIKITGDDFFIDRSLCDNCLECVEVCSAEALRPVGEWKTVDEIMETVLRDKGYYEKSGGGLTISGGELLSQWEFAEMLLDAAVEKGISVALDTSGAGSGEALLRMAKKADHILYDMKCIVNKGHKEYMGSGNELILDNLSSLASDPEINRKINIRMPLIHDVNDMDEVIAESRDFYTEKNLQFVTLLPYHELGMNKSRGIGCEFSVFSAPDHDRLHEVESLFSSAGMNVEILGEDIA